jgi:hypothetical protein
VRPSFAAALVACAAIAAGCSSGPGGVVPLSWQFSDGRDCLDAGASRVELRLAPPAPGDAPDAEFDCADGFSPAMVKTPMLPGGGTLYLDARSPAGGDLYRGTLALDATFAVTPVRAALVTLYAAAAN